ncbi:DUF4270 domain-containing protein [Aestuariibaculum sediminum]|uniref:DUF4270 domain-containing protein n=1 Tax=Aestuariibaculum sediminum TaxID=2770637 RepID=A0A8J6Q6T0_9FLAO|nr:DUF4270 domain-containing protein [Aestuariibaculum sediminum]MBD0831065.1 DUF4270 domain-containing protein [Aestuariibaculum sediminum]
MKKTINALKYCVVYSIVIASLIACDSEFASVDSNVLGDENTNFQTNKESLPILAYNKKLDSLQIDGLSSYLLGVFNDPAYGQTTASIVTQLTPSTFSPNFGDETVIDSVVMTIPYYSRINDSDENGNLYTIGDSLYGDANAPIKLSVYKNNYYLRDFDPNGSLGEAQNYFSKGDGEVNMTDNFSINGTSTINFDEHKGDLLFENLAFLPSSDRIRLDTFDEEDGSLEETTYIAPALRVKLDTEFWKTTIIDQEDNDVLSSSSVFKNYFRGLYFKAEATSTSGQMVMLDLSASNANITIYYSYSATTGTGDNAITTDFNSTYTLNFSGKTLNTFINDYNKVSLADGNQVDGDEKLYLKGTEGSMGVVNLFPTEADLENFINNYRIPLGNNEYKKDERGNYILKRLINEAQLVVYEDETMPTGGDDSFHDYDRLYAYDIKNNSVLADYVLDPITNSASPYNSLIVHLGQRRSDDTGRTKYKIRITEHLNNILLKDSTNTKIGLVLSTNVNANNTAKLLNKENQEVSRIPSASIITPRGTIVHGTNSAIPEAKMKLEVYFTEPK